MAEDKTAKALREAVDACTDLAKDYAALVVRLAREERERASLVRRLGARQQEKARAVAIINYALHLRVHGERAPGGDETWAQFDRMAEEFIRAHLSLVETGEAAGVDAG